MKLNAKVGRHHQKQSKGKSGKASDQYMVIKAGQTYQKDNTPDYSSMKKAIKKISHSVSFDSLKSFYRV